MNTIAHISDIHFGRELPVVLESLLLKLEELQPGLIILSGDLTQRAKTAEFQAARAFLQRLRQPYLVIPGNHDMPAHNVLARFWNPWQRWREHISPELEPVMQSDPFTAIGVNTARRMGLWTLDWSRGRINRQQMQRIKQLFDTLPPTCLRLVVAHHPFWLPEENRDRGLIGRRKEALQAFREAGVDVILGGHVHVPFVQLVDNIIVSHAGTTFSNRLNTGYPNSFNVVCGDRDCVDMRQMRWDGSGFAQSSNQLFHRHADGWKLETATG